MPDFSNLAPPVAVTNPDGQQGAQYPKHLYQYASAGADGLPLKENAIAVAWDGKTPIYNAILVVGSESEESAAVDKGWSVGVVLAAPKAKK